MRDLHKTFTILGTPLDAPFLQEIESSIKTFLERNIVDEGDNYEIEAKFGRFIDYSTKRRITLPISTSCVLQPGNWYHFESDIPMELHRHFNRLFNEQVAKHKDDWKYKHLKTVDVFYTHPNYKRLRVTKDPQTNHILEVIDKRRIADFALHIPASPLDARISINVEDKPRGIDAQALVNLPLLNKERHKDRISYEFEGFLKVDLTQVRQEGRMGGGVVHELEIELAHHRTKDLEDPNLARALLNNVLDIARVAADLPYNN